MGEVYRETHSTTGKLKKVWLCWFRDAQGRRVRLSTGESSKTAAQQFLIEREKEVEAEKLGILKHRETRRQDVAELIGDFCARLDGLKKSRGYVDDVEFTLSTVVELTGVNTLAELDTAALTRGLAKYQKGRKARSHNKARGFLVHFFKWLMKQGLWDRNPAELTERVPEHDKKRRRALTEHEFALLLQSVPEYRRVIYLFAARTGLRRGAIAGLTWADINLDEGTVATRVMRAKNRREKIKPLSVELLTVMKAWRASHPGLPAAPVFPRVPGVRTLQGDLERIGLEKVTADGVFDFHSLKVQLATDLDRAGVSPRIAMEILDHSDIRLTLNLYTKVERDSQKNALDALGWQTGCQPEADDDPQEQAGA